MVILFIYAIGVIITHFVVKKQLFNEYLKSKAKITFDSWLEHTEKDEYLLHIPFVWPLFVIAIIINNIKKYNK
jgi:hypothetical protein